MTHIEQLIQDMCPNGVEFKKLGEVCELKRGSGITESQAIEGNIPVIAGGQKPAYYHNQSNREGQNITVAGSGAYAGYVAFWEQPIFVSDAFTVTPKDTSLDIKFVYYFLKNIQTQIHNTKKGSGVPHVHPSSISDFEIPIPPLEIQERIVAILDAFSSLAAELQAELQAELHLRRKQYEYYRTQLLTPHSDGNSADNSDDCNWEWKQITDIADTFIGLATSVTKYKRPQGVLLLHNSDIKEGRIELKTVEYLDTDFVQKNGSKILHTDDIITVHTGDVGTSAVITPEYDGTIGFTTISSRIKDKTIITPAFLCKILNSEVCKNAIASKTISDRNNLNLASFDELRIPIPPLAEQERIVAILDKFEALTTSLSDGIPAEQAAQQKRYEYYRDKLLTFEKRP